MSKKRFHRGQRKAKPQKSGPQGHLRFTARLAGIHRKSLLALLIYRGEVISVSLQPGRGRQLLASCEGTELGFSKKPIPRDFFSRLRVEANRVNIARARTDPGYRKNLRQIELAMHRDDIRGHHHPSGWQWGTPMSKDEQGEFVKRRLRLSTDCTARYVGHRCLLTNSTRR
jgi:hypothetical protein